MATGNRMRRIFTTVVAVLVVMGIGGTATALSLRNPAYNGVWQAFGGGWQYMYSSHWDAAYWRDRSLTPKFAYAYKGGQWHHFTELNGSLSRLGGTGVSASFIGDGAWHGLNNSFQYLYSSYGDAGYWRDSSLTKKFAYAYNSGQWYHFTELDGSPSRLGGTGVSANFVGDGAWHGLNNSCQYLYSSYWDAGYWRDRSLTPKFAYAYNSGQWYHFTELNGSLSLLGGTGVSANFVGDGAWHSLGKSFWSFDYLYSSYWDAGYWSEYYENKTKRFAYAYNSGQWYHFSVIDGSQSRLGGTGVSANFVGDGNYHDLGNGWSYCLFYSNLANEGHWKNINTGIVQFAYVYAYLGDSGKWYHQDHPFNGTGGWQRLGNPGLSASFVGDGNTHDIGGGWLFLYKKSENISYWTNTSLNLWQYAYDYSTSQWWHEGRYGSWKTLGRAGMDATFVGSGSHPIQMPISGGWREYTYYTISNGSVGVWIRLVGSDWRYFYDIGVWQYSNDAGTTWFDYGGPYWSALFPG